MSLTFTRLTRNAINEIKECNHNDLIFLDDGDTYSSAKGALFVLDGNVYDLNQILNFFFDNASEEMKEGVSVQTL